MKQNLTCYLAGLLFLLAAEAKAQHHWLQPDTFLVVKKATVSVGFQHGTALDSASAGLLPKTQISRLTLFAGYDSTSLPPASSFTLAEAQLKNLGLVSAVLTLTPVSLAQPVVLGQLTKEQRSQLQLTDSATLQQPFRAQQLHFAKCLISSFSRGRSDVYKKQLDHPLEILLLQNPNEVPAGQTLSVQVIRDMRVLPFHPVKVLHRNFKGEIKSYQVKTSKQGVARVPLKDPGMYVLLTEQTGPNTAGLQEEGALNWQKLSASFTFYIP